MANNYNERVPSTLHWNQYFSKVSALMLTTKKFPFRSNSETMDGSGTAEKNQSSKQRLKKRKKLAVRNKQSKLKASIFQKASNGQGPKRTVKAECAATPNKSAITYSKFDFGPSNNNEQNKGKKKLNKEKTLQLCLKQQTIKKKKLEKMLNEDPCEGARVLHSDSWDAAVSRAKGIKVKDDIKLLKKAIQQKKDKRRRSAKQWKERWNQVEDKKQKRQQARRNNIKNKNSAKKKFKHSAGF